MGRALWTPIGAALHGIADLIRNAAVRRALWVLIFLAATTTLFASVSLPKTVNLKAGEVAPYTVTAPTEMINRPATAQRRSTAAASVAPVYSTDANVTQSSLTALDGDTTAIQSARTAWAAALAKAASQTSSTSATGGGAPASPPGGQASSPASSVASPPSLAQAATALGKKLGMSGPLPDLEAALTATPHEVDAAVAAARQTVSTLMGEGVLQSHVAAAQAQVRAAVNAAGGPQALDALIGQLGTKVLVSNRFENGLETDAKQAAARAAVQPVVIAAGEVIVRQGDVVTPDEVEILQDAGLLHPGGTFGVLATSVAVALLLMAMCWAFIAEFYRTALQDEVRLVLFGSLLIGSLVTVRLGSVLSPFLAPTPWAAMLATVAFGPGMGVFVGGVAGLGAGLLDHNLAVAACATLGAWTAVFALWRVRQRSDLVRAGLYSAAAEVAAVLILVGLFLGHDTGVGTPLLSKALNAPPLLQETIAAAFTGLLSGPLAIGMLPYAEVLGVLTPFQLLEMANPSQPLLRRLLLEAPGTYHHSLMVANLAEAACEAVGGDALLVRTAAYYHDIGKMKRPAFFVENQQGGRNPHDQLAPRLSAQIIISHVRDGVDMARQARLPRELVEFIRTHHGTTLVQYFYHQAREQQGSDGGVPLAESDFRYEGPIPDSRELTVLMLADGVEAAVRALKNPSEEDIGSTIRMIIDQRLEDGQLDRAPLTLADLDVIRETFQRILVGVYHTRITYPQDAGRLDMPSDAAQRLATRQPG